MFAQENTGDGRNIETKENAEKVQQELQRKMQDPQLSMVEPVNGSSDSSKETSQVEKKTDVLSSLKQGLHLIKCLCDKSVKIEFINRQGNVVSFRNMFSKKFLSLSNLPSNVYWVKANGIEKKSQ